MTARPRSRLLRAAGGKFGYLLVALIALMATAPVIGEGWFWRRLLAAVTSGVLVAGLYAVRPGRRSLAIGLALAGLDLGIGGLVALSGAGWLVVLQSLLWMATLGYVAATILEGAVLGSDRVTLETLQAAFCVFLLLGLVWAFAYSLVELFAPGSFLTPGGGSVVWADHRSRRTGFMRLLIFSYATLTSTSYAGLSAVGGFPNMAACLEAMTAQIYLAVVIARLVGLQAAPPPPGPAEPPVLETDPVPPDPGRPAPGPPPG